MAVLAADFNERYGPWALVCGASDGIGEAFAQQIAAAGVNVALLARRAPLLAELASSLSKEHGVEARAIVADLRSPDLLDTVRRATADIEVGLLVYVSGSQPRHELFLDAAPELWLDQVRLNCDGPIRLGHHFGRAMRARGRGGLLFLTSLACLSGAARISAYCGTKAFDQMFAESLWHELAPHGVDVLCLMVGATHTPTADETLGLDFAALFPDPGLVAQPPDVAREGLENLAGGPVRVAGEALRAAFPQLASAARAAAVEAGSRATAVLDGWDGYRPVWDAARGEKIRR